MQLREVKKEKGKEYMPLEFHDVVLLAMTGKEIPFVTIRGKLHIETKEYRRILGGKR